MYPVPVKPELHLQLELSRVEPALQNKSCTAFASQVLHDVQEDNPVDDV